MSNFLQCYHDMIKESKSNCAAQYGSAFECMQANINTQEVQGEVGPCSGSLTTFSNCKWVMADSSIKYETDEFI